MTQRVDPKLPLLEKMRLLTPSPENQTCECAGNYQCAGCVIKEALERIQQLQHEQRFAKKLMWSHAYPLPADFEDQALIEIRKQINTGHLQMINFDNRYKSAVLWLI